MTVSIRGTVPAEEFVLSETFEHCPEVEVDCARTAHSCDRSVMPLLWFRYDERAELEAALATDDTVESFDCLSECPEKYLYRVEWSNGVDLSLGLLTCGATTVLDVTAADDRWQFRIIYPDRDRLSETYEFADERGLTFEVESVQELDDDSVGRHNLTTPQYRTLELAAERGYFNIPRSVSLEELADELDITHQALSERMRRATGSILENTFVLANRGERERIP